MAKPIEIGIHYTIPNDYVEEGILTVDQVNADLQYLTSLFGKRYLKFFHQEHYYVQHLMFAKMCAGLLRRIEDCEGFNRFVKQYDNHNHLFTARVAGFLKDNGITVALEPEMPTKAGPHPDLKLTKGEEPIYGECKTSDIWNYYRKSEKQKIADFLYGTVQTCDQITLYMDEDVDLALVQEVFGDKDVIQSIYRTYEPGADQKETNLQVHEKIRVNVIQRPTIAGGEEDHLQGEMMGYLESNETRERMIGITFLRGGRSIGVYSSVNFELKWKDKREQSEKQMVPEYPNVVFVDGTDVVGDPALHQEYFDGVWLTKEAPNCSAVGQFEYFQSGGQDEMVEKLGLHLNEHATNPIGEEFFADALKHEWRE